MTVLLLCKILILSYSVEVHHKVGMPVPGPDIFLRIFKEEKILEVWIKRPDDSVFHIAKVFPIKNHMPLGPKQSDRDGKVPEGFYYTRELHHINLGVSINFPNPADKIIHNNQKIKGDPRIVAGVDSVSSHIVLSKEHLQEIYAYLLEAKNAGREYIPIHIFPFSMSTANLERKLSENKNDRHLHQFWLMIKPGYTFFEKSHNLPVYTYSRTGYWFRFHE